MDTTYGNWAATERTFLQDERKWLKAGGKVFSPSGDDITDRKLAEIELRIEHTTKAVEWAIAKGYEKTEA